MHNFTLLKRNPPQNERPTPKVGNLLIQAGKPTLEWDGKQWTTPSSKN